MDICFVPPSRLSGLPEDTPLLVAFSGGADSRLLLELTARWAISHGAAVTAAHLHHGIRGAEADRDEDFCRRTVAALCAQGLLVDYVSRRVDVPARTAASGRSIEWEARLARYEFFADVMTQRHIPVLLTAHHADDQLETLLLRLLRGSGTRGLGGIPPVRTLEGMEGSVVIRPLLDCTRQEILAACHELGLTYVTDSTNLTDDCTRNCLRHQVLPRLEDIVGAGIPQKAAARLCQAAREDEECLAAMARQALSTVNDRGDGRLSLAALRALPPALSKRCLMYVYQQVTAGTCAPADNSLSAAHLEAMLTLVQSGLEAAAVHLPKRWQACISSERLCFLPPAPPTSVASKASPPAPRPLFIGSNTWNAGTGEVQILLEHLPAPEPPLKRDGVLASAIFPGDIPLPLWARQRQAGDTIFSHGMNKKLKKILCGAHIPSTLRDKLPLICLSDPSINGPGAPLWFPTAVFRDGWPAPTDGDCLRVSIIEE